MAVYRVVACDVDGTLLDPSGVVRASTRDAVRAAVERGTRFVLATSRRWTGTVPIASALDLNGPLILYDGAIVQHYPSGEVLAVRPLAAAEAQRAAELMHGYGLQPVAQFGGADDERLRASVCPTHPEWTADYFRSYPDQVEMVPIERLCTGQPDPLRIVAFGPLPVLRVVAPKLAPLGFARQLLLAGSYGMAELTVFSRQTSKGAALLTLGRLLGIPAEQTLAIGDGLNDISMLRAAGLGLAMANAPRRVRSVAKALTTSNDDDGVAHALHRYVLDSEQAMLDDVANVSGDAAE